MAVELLPWLHRFLFGSDDLLRVTMPLQNRVKPTGEILADPARGLMMGNRGGALHDAGRRLGPRRWVTRQWICCRIAFNGRRREVMTPGRYTELFFLDEATALAAGHRPCFECRRAEAEAFAAHWARARGEPGRARAADIDRILHAERLDWAGGQRRHTARLADLPAFAMIADPQSGHPVLVLPDVLRPWSMSGYGAALPRPRLATVEALTPPGIIAVLKSGYRPLVHESALVSG